MMLNIGILDVNLALETFESKYIYMRLTRRYIHQGLY